MVCILNKNKIINNAGLLGIFRALIMLFFVVKGLGFWVGEERSMAALSAAGGTLGSLNRSEKPYVLIKYQGRRNRSS